MPASGEKESALSGLPRGEDAAAGEGDLVGGDVEQRRRDAARACRELARGQMRGAGDRAGKAARIIAGGDRPGVRAVSSSPMTRISAGARPSTSATTCASTVRWPWPCGTEATWTLTPPSGSSATVAVACAPLLGPALRRSSGVSTVVM